MGIFHDVAHQICLMFDVQPSAASSAVDLAFGHHIIPEIGWMAS
jgi:hypothetical protein